MRADWDAAVVPFPTGGAHARVRSDASAVVVAAPHDVVDALTTLAEPPAVGSGLVIIVCDARPERKICVLDEKIVTENVFSAIRSRLKIERFIAIVGAGSVKFQDARSFDPGITGDKGPVAISPPALVCVRVEHLTTVRVNP